EHTMAPSLKTSLKRASITFTTVACGAALLAFAADPVAFGQSQPSAREALSRSRFTHDSVVDDETGSSSLKTASALTASTEAPTGFDNLTNGFDPQGDPFETLNEDNVVALRSFNDNRFIFEEVEKVEEGLGPTYNAQSCRECHQNVVTGGASQVTEQRTGHLQ